MKQLYQNYSNSLKAIIDGKYTNCELFPGFSKLAANAILAATDHRANTTPVCLPYDDDYLLEDILIDIIKRIDKDPLIGDDWIKIDPSITEEKFVSICNEWRQKIDNKWENWNETPSQFPQPQRWEKLSHEWIGIAKILELIILINPSNKEDILNLVIPPLSLVENPPVVVDPVQDQTQEIIPETGVQNPPVVVDPEQSESVQEQIQEQLVPELNNEVVEEKESVSPQPSEEVATEEPVSTTNSLGIPNENSNLRVPIEPVSLVDPSLSMTLGEESLDPIPEMRFRDMTPEANAFYTIRGRKHYSNKRQAPLVFLLETSMEHLRKLGITHCVVSNIKFDTTGQLIDLVVSDQSTHKKFYVYFDTVGRHVDICTSKK